jgi:hypothetical protein
MVPEPAGPVAGGGRRLATLLRLVPGDRGERVPAGVREHDLKQLPYLRD